jgi:phosphoribosylglycinamide formyltransferase 2
LAHGQGVPVVQNLEDALNIPHSEVRVFGKPSVNGERRVAVALSRAENIETANANAQRVASLLDVQVVGADLGGVQC